jgi:hypothetical protein
VRVRLVRPLTRACLERHLEPGLHKPVRDLRNEGHTGLAGGGFLWDGDDHSFADGERGRGTLAESALARAARRP